MIKFRNANPRDLLSIARLHAESWRAHYRGNFSDEYLDGPVYEDRLMVWTKRFEETNPYQQIVLAESKKELFGFVCIYLSKDQKFGALIDNLHVAKTSQGQGIGKSLMKEAANLIAKKSKFNNYYLYVLTNNESAIAFYKKIGGRLDGREVFENPGGGQSEVYRVVWNQE